MENLIEQYAEAVEYIAKHVDDDTMRYAISQMNIECKSLEVVCPNLLNQICEQAETYCELNELEEGAYLIFGDPIDLAYDVIDKWANDNKDIDC